MERVILQDSNKILLNDFFEINEEIFTSLLEEAHEKNLSDKTKIKVTRERLVNQTEKGDPIIGFQTLYYNFGTLKERYKGFYGKEYSPETEDQRQEEIFEHKEYLERCRTGARNGIYEIMQKMQTGRVI